MSKINKPKDTVEDIWNVCIPTYRDADKMKKLLQCVPIITKLANSYDEYAEKHMLHVFQEHTKVGKASKQELVDVYNNKFVKGPGRAYYDKIKALAPKGICPLCGIRIVSTLDHHLEKAKFPAFAVLPTNLIPACKDCNTDKKTFKFTSRGNQTIHPYYEDVENILWLVCKLDNNCVPSYSTICYDGCDEEKYQRIKKHFEVFDLNKLYSVHAGEEIASNRYSWKKLLEKGGISQLREHFQDSYESNKHYKLNSWKTALYKALMEFDFLNYTIEI